MVHFLPHTWYRRQQPAPGQASLKQVTSSDKFPAAHNSSHHSLVPTSRKPGPQLFDRGDESLDASSVYADTRVTGATSGYSRFLAIMEQVDLKQVTRLATRIRTENSKLSSTGTVRRLQMLRFSCKVTESPLYGSFNILLPIRFRDRVRWLLKLPGNGTYENWDEQSARALTSEVMTMKLIYNNSSVPVPRIYGFDVTTANPLKSPYILMERIDGGNLFLGWFYNKSRAGRGRFRDLVIPNLAKAMVQLNTFTFPAAGALQYDPVMKTFDIGPYRKVNHYTAYGDTNFYSQQGPFTDPIDYFMASLDRNDTHELAPTRQGQVELLRLFIDWFFQATSTMEDLTGFVLTHPDFALQNIMVGNDGSIRGLVDWDGVVAVPRCIGCHEYPLWLTIDWDPHYWNYDRMGECVKAEPVMLPAELEHYRALYVQSMKTALHDVPQGTFSAADPNEPIKENGKEHSATTTKLSCLARSLYISANEPKALEYNIDMIVEKIIRFTAGERFNNHPSDTHTYTATDGESQRTENLNDHRNRHESTLNDPKDNSRGGLSAVQVSVGHSTSMSDEGNPTELALLDSGSVHGDKNGAYTNIQEETENIGESALPKFTDSIRLRDSSLTTNFAFEQRQQKLMAWVSTICIFILSMPVLVTMLLMALHSFSKTPLVLLFGFFLFSSSSITVNITIMLLYGLFFARAPTKDNSRLMLKITQWIVTSRIADTCHASALFSQSRGRASGPDVPMLASVNDYHENVPDNVNARDVHRAESIPQIQPSSPSSDTTCSAYQSSSTETMLPATDIPAAEGDWADKSDKSDNSNISEKSDSTNITVPSLRGPDHRGAGAVSRRQFLGPRGEDLFAMTDEERLERIEQIWEEDPTYDFGGFTDRDLSNALYKGNLDAARMRRLKIGFQRLLASLDDRFADFNGLTLRSERFDSKIFIISVGEENKEYAVHESVLRKPPIFAAMCEGQFKKAFERRISLPVDNNPQDIAAVVEHM
ncbi:MAG: hypothetical protein Q9197_006451 [Variospora fuerteventurae]